MKGTVAQGQPGPGLTLKEGQLEGCFLTLSSYTAMCEPGPASYDWRRTHVTGRWVLGSGATWGLQAPRDAGPCQALRG